MFCTNCGKQLVENAKYCIHCGKKIDGDIASTAVSTPEQAGPLSADTPDISKELTTYKLTISRPDQFFLVNPAMNVCIDNQIKCAVENGKAVALDLPAGAHSIQIKASIRKREVNLTLNGDTELVLSFDRVTGGINAKTVVAG